MENSEFNQRTSTNKIQIVLLVSDGRHQRLDGQSKIEKQNILAKLAVYNLSSSEIHTQTHSYIHPGLAYMLLLCDTRVFLYLLPQSLIAYFFHFISISLKRGLFIKYLLFRIYIPIGDKYTENDVLIG